MKRAQVLVAEDDANLRAGLVDMLESDGYAADAAADGAEALALFGRRPYDLVLLDLMMPLVSGYDVCRQIRAVDADMPIIILTAKGQEVDKVVGLRMGADDYVTKPFGVQELLARIAAALRRTRRLAAGGHGEPVERFSFGPAEIDALRYRGWLGKREFDLSARELNLLKVFAAHPDEVLTRDRLLNAVWGIDYLGTTRTLDQHVARLRKKIEPKPATPTVIETVHGVGYRYTG
jgi:DNA-binding response OmpR family regulator